MSTFSYNMKLSFGDARPLFLKTKQIMSWSINTVSVNLKHTDLLFNKQSTASGKMTAALLLDGNSTYVQAKNNCVNLVIDV